MNRLDIDKWKTNPKSLNAILYLVISFELLVYDKTYKYFRAVKFIYGLPKLVTLIKFDHSAEM